MSFSSTFARALAPVAIFASAASAAPADNADLAKVQAHITSVDTMTANFVQTDAKGRSAAGTLQLRRPGRIRFQYGSGDLLLVGTGGRLIFLDYQVGQKSSWDLNKTPLGMLLSPSPNVKRMAKIVPDRDPRVVVVRAGASYGTLILAFIHSNSAPGGLQLYGWTAVDPQNKKTKVTLTNVRYNVGVSDAAFRYAEPQKRRR